MISFNKIIVSAYIVIKTMEVVDMFFQINNEYIKYLNDPERNGLNYDQWKERKKRQEAEKSKKNHYRNN